MYYKVTSFSLSYFLCT